MKKTFLLFFLIIGLVYQCFALEYQQINDNIGVGKIVIGKSRNNDVLELYGFKCDLINHLNYSFELRYEKIGTSFFYYCKDRQKIIFSISLSKPFLGVTSKGIVLGESTIQDVINKYGKGNWYSTNQGDTWWLEYPGIQFHVKIDKSIPKYPLKEAYYLDKKIIVIKIEGAYPYRDEWDSL